MNPSIWSETRRQPDISDASGLNGHSQESLPEQTSVEAKGSKIRSIFQQDYDRLLFSTPVRRLADKTQVWPMDENDGVRTRLTHSHEVANLARSIGTRAFAGVPHRFKDEAGAVNLGETVQPILLAIGLGHDLGNPPFGHQGEAAIGRWFETRKSWIFTRKTEEGGKLDQPVPETLWGEFTEFDGNPQSLRLLTKLQTHIEGLGLDLSAATLAAGLKYPVHFSNRNKESASAKKGGYFEAERDVVNWMRGLTDLKEGERHPLTWIMEACDDIAYSVLDVDDLLKKGVISPDDVLAALRRNLAPNNTLNKITRRFEHVESKDFVPSIQRDIKVQYLRAFLIEDLIGHASDMFIANSDDIFNYRQQFALMDSSPLCETLKGIAQQNAFNHPAVLRTEALGARTLDGLMTALWEAISDRKSDDLTSKRRTAHSKYLYSLISPNYIQQAVVSAKSAGPASGLRYRELRLLTDMVAGMTDSFAMKLWEDVKVICHADGT